MHIGEKGLAAQLSFGRMAGTQDRRQDVLLFAGTAVLVSVILPTLEIRHSADARLLKRCKSDIYIYMSFFDRKGRRSNREKGQSMEITFNTQNADASVALKALRLYKDKNYKEATAALTEILDYEPGNWDARLLLAACYYRTQQYMTAQRIFKFVADGSPDRATRLKALEAINVITGVLQNKSTDLPPEFGAYANRHCGQISWLESA